MSDNNSSISIKDNNSQIISILPKEWVEPLIIIAKIKGYNGIDEYVLEMIGDRLEMFIDTRDELGESFQKYMQNIEGLEDLSAAEEEEESKSNKEKDYVNVKIDSDIVERLVKVEERKKQRQQQQEKEKEDPTTDENVSKFVKKVHESYNDLKKADDKEKEDLR